MPENLSLGFANNKVADQPVHLRRLIRDFVIHFLERFISKHATGKISIFKLVTVDDEADFSHALSETHKTGFGVSRLNIIWASSRENLSSGFPTKRDSNQSPQL